jgi:hypothetical protein
MGISKAQIRASGGYHFVSPQVAGMKGPSDNGFAVNWTPSKKAKAKIKKRRPKAKEITGDTR